MLYFLIGIIALIAALMFLRLRIRVDITGERKLLFVGIGRTGPEFDFSAGQGVLRFAGFDLRRFELKKDGKRKQRKAKPGVARAGKAPKTKEKRRRPVGETVALLRESAGALWKYVTGLLTATIVEQADGEIEAGFGSPHLTGQAFGYYQAVLAAAPGLLGRIQYIPVWNGPAFSGAVHATVAWPMYRLVWETTVLVARLPLRKIVKLAIGTKEGVQDGE
jgi:hypothetical protein